MENRAKNGAIVKLIVWSVVLVLLVSLTAGMLVGEAFEGFRFGVITFGGSYTYDDCESYNTGNMEYRDTEVEIIDLSCITGTVNVSVWEESYVKLEETGAGDRDEDQMRSRVENGVLTVKFMKSGVRAYTNTLSKVLTLRIPAEMAESLQNLNIDGASAKLIMDGTLGEENRLCVRGVDVETASGAVDIKCKRIMSLDVDTASGNVMLEGTFGVIDVDAASADVTVKGMVDSIDIDTASGRVEIDGDVEKAKIDAVSGAVTLNAHTVLPKSLELDAVSGNAEISLPDIEYGFVATMDSASGKMTCNGSKSDYYTYGKGQAEYEFSSVSGSVRITIRGK